MTKACEWATGRHVASERDDRLQLRGYIATLVGERCRKKNTVTTGTHVCSGVLGAFIGVLGAWGYGAKGERGEQLTYAEFIGVPVGASGGEVIRRIGYPVEINLSSGWQIPPLDPNAPWAEGYNWVYATPNRWFLKEGLAVYVNMRDGRVVALYAKYDDMPVFSSRLAPGENPDGLKRLESELKK